MSDNTPNTFTGYLGVDFQLKLFWQLLTEYEFALKIIPSLEISYFDDSTHKQFFLVIKDYFDEFNTPPNLGNKSIYVAIKRSKLSDNVVTNDILEAVTKKIKDWDDSVLNGNVRGDGDIVQNNTFQFIKQQEYRKLASFINDKTKEGTIRTNITVINEVEDKIKVISNIGVEEDEGTEVFDDIDSALTKEYRKCIPTGIAALDEIMGGGLGKGEIGLLLAASGVGKTTYLTKIANTAVNNGYKALQIIFEDKPKDIQRKHFTLWSEVKLSELNDNVDYVKEKVFEHQKKIETNGGLLTIKKFIQDETTIIDVKNWIERTQKKLGIKYDIVTLDYIDCLEPHKNNTDQHESELAIIKTFESMASEFDIPMWSALQGNRSSFNAEFLTAENMGGNIKRAQKTHFLMSVAKTLQQKESGTANLSILKARFATDGQQFKDAIYNNDTMQIRITDNVVSTTEVKEKYGVEKLDKIAENNSKLHESVSNASSMLEQYKNMKEDIVKDDEGIDDTEKNAKDFDNFNDHLNKTAENQGNIIKAEEKNEKK